MIDSMIAHLTDSLRNKVQLMVGRALMLAVNDANAIQTMQLQVLADETQDDVENLQQYGFTSVPHPQAEAVVVYAGGNRDHGIVIATGDRRYRLRGMAGGEVAVHDDLGQCVHLTRAGIVIDGASLPVTIKNAPKVRMETALLEVTGDIKDLCDASGKTMSGMRATYNAHTHPGDSGGTTSIPNQPM